MSVGTSSRELFNKHINNLSSKTYQQLVSVTVGMIDKMFRHLLTPKVDSGVEQAVSTANATVNKWGSKVCCLFSFKSAAYAITLYASARSLSLCGRVIVSTYNVELMY